MHEEKGRAKGQSQGGCLRRLFDKIRSPPGRCGGDVPWAGSFFLFVFLGFCFPCVVRTEKKGPFSLVFGAVFLLE